VRRQILCAGRGGQGVVWLGRVLGEAARRTGAPVLTAETHGMAMRGGSVVCHVKIGPFSSPLIRAGRADVLLALDPDEADRNRHFLGPGGAALVHPTDVDALALAGSPRGANAALLGAACGRGLTGLDPAAVEAAVADLSPPGARQANLRAFRAGVGAAGQPCDPP